MRDTALRGRGLDVKKCIFSARDAPPPKFSRPLQLLAVLSLGRGNGASRAPLVASTRAPGSVSRAVARAPCSSARRIASPPPANTARRCPQKPAAMALTGCLSLPAALPGRVSPRRAVSQRSTATPRAAPARRAGAVAQAGSLFAPATRDSIKPSTSGADALRELQATPLRVRARPRGVRVAVRARARRGGARQRARAAAVTAAPSVAEPKPRLRFLPSAAARRRTAGGRGRLPITWSPWAPWRSCGPCCGMCAPRARARCGGL
jgi:hypothetical protein